MAGDKCKLTGRSAFGAPLKEFVGVKWFAVFVDAEKRHVDVIARISEVVWVAAEEGGLLLGSKDEADIGIDLVLVKPILAAVIKGDNVGAKAAGGFLAFLFDCGLFSVAGLE